MQINELLYTASKHFNLSTWTPNRAPVSRLKTVSLTVLIPEDKVHSDVPPLLSG